MNCLIVGASAGLGRCLAEALARQGHDLVLVASDRRDLEAVAQDLRIRFARTVAVADADLAAFDANVLRDRILEEVSPVDGLFLVAGVGDPEDCGPLPVEHTRRLIEVNLAAPMLIAQAFLPHLLARPEAHLVGIGSVATIRGRARNMVYGAAKRGMEFFFEALLALPGNETCKIQFYRAGFMATTMFSGKPSLLVARPEAVADHIVRHLNSPQGLFWVPWFWAGIAFLLRLIPAALFRRLKI